MKKSFVLVRVMFLVLAGVLLLGTLTVVGVKLVQAVNLGNEIWACSIDTDGSNDEVNQGDMTQMCTDINPDNSGTFGIKWSWDDLVGPGGNKYFACSLFDTNENGKADNAVCVQILAAPTTGNLQWYATYSYTCGDDSATKCTQPLVETPNNSLCSVATTETDPFYNGGANEDNPGGMGNAYPKDTTAECSVPNAVVGEGTSTLINVCSYTSDSSPNSDPKDCIFEKVSPGAFITIRKIAEPDKAVDFVFTTTNGTTTRTDTITGSGTSARFFVPAGTYSIGEAVPTDWNLTDVACTESDTPITITGDNPISVPVGVNDDIVCTFTNQSSVDISVTKSDGDYTVMPMPSLDNPNYKYTLTVTNSGPATAYDVVVTDTLDAHTSFDDTKPVTVGGVDIGTAYTFTPDGDAIAGGGTLAIDLGDLAPGSVDIEFWVKIEVGVPTPGILEIGDTCPTDGSADICNKVEVSTSNPETNTTNNTAYEPKDVPAPTSVDLLEFKGVGKLNGVVLRWSTASELDLIGFNVYRAGRIDGAKKLVNATSLITAVSPGAVEGYSYRYAVKGLIPGKLYFFWLEDVDLNGNTTLHGPIRVRVRN